MDIQNLLPFDLFLQVSGITSGRAATISYALMGLISVVMGWMAMARSARIGPGRLRAIVALVCGLTGTALSIFHLTSSTGGFGTGSGKLGAIVALMLAVLGMVLGGLALTRLRRTGRRQQ